MNYNFINFEFNDMDESKIRNIYENSTKEIKDGFRLRLVDIKDLDKLCELENKAFDKGIAEDRKTIEDRIKIFPFGFVVLEHKDKIIGSFSTEIWNYKENMDFEGVKLNHNMKDYHNIDGNMMFISSFLIDSDYRGLGLGKSFFNEARELIKNNFSNIEKEVLAVSLEWQNAINIYKSFGFEVEKTIKNYFYNAKTDIYEDIYVMVK